METPIPSLSFIHLVISEDCSLLVYSDQERNLYETVGCNNAYKLTLETYSVILAHLKYIASKGLLC